MDRVDTQLWVDPLQYLPTELALLILEKLTPPDIVTSCMVVCGQWNVLCNDDLLWRHFCMKACNAKQTKKAMKKMKEDSEGTSWKTVYSNYACPFQGSTLLDPNHKKILSEWLDPGNIWQLHYRASVDGFTHDTFHKRCDNQGPTVTVVLSKNGSLFGGYNSHSWAVDGDPSMNRSMTAFIFSLVNPHKTPPVRLFAKTPSSACFSIAYYGPTWGAGYDLGIMGFPQGKETSAWTRLGCSYPAPDRQIYKGHPHFFLAGEPRDFDITEVEVFTLKRKLTPIDKLEKIGHIPPLISPLSQQQGSPDEPGQPRDASDEERGKGRDKDKGKRKRKGFWEFLFG